MANSQVVAYTTFIASEAFLADKSLVDKALDYLKKREGALRYISLSSRMFDGALTPTIVYSVASRLKFPSGFICL